MDSNVLPSRAGRTLLLGSSGPLLRRLTELLVEGGETVEVLLAPMGGASSDGLERLGATLLDGDPRAMDFGLRGADYVALTKRVTRVFTVLSPVEEHDSDLERVDALRVARETSEFVQAGGASDGVTHLSTLGVFGDARSMVLESQLQVGQSFHHPLEEAAAVAELILGRLASRVPVRILRVGALLGDARTGELTAHSLLGEIVRRVERSPHISEIRFRDEPLRIETTDRAAEALSILSRETRSTTVHLVDDNAPTDRRFLEWIGDRLDREFREIANSGRGRRVPSPLERLPGHERRFFSGDSLRYGRTEALRIVPSLLDRPWETTLERLVLARRSPAETSSEA